MGKINVKKWKAKDGDMCFRFPEREPFERWWIIVAVAVFLIIIVGVEYMLNGSQYSLYPSTFIFVFAFLHWMSMPMKSNETVIEKTVHEIMDEHVRSDARAKGTDVRKSFVHYDTKGTYAIITRRCFLALLKNGEVWEYPIVYHKATNKREGYYKCGRSYIVSENEEHIKAIHPKRWSRFVAKFKLSDNAKLWLIILGILMAGGLSFVSFCWLLFALEWWMLLLVGGYLGLCSLIEWLSKIWNSRVMGVVNNIVSVPKSIVYILTGMIQPFITIAGTYIFLVMYAFGLPALILKGMASVGWWVLKAETITFIVVAFGSVLCCSYSVTKWILRHTPIKNWGNHDYELHREELAFYLVHPSNMVFILYFVYFGFLTVSGFTLIQNGTYLITESFDMAILKAFLVYIAYTNMRLKAKDTELEAKVLLQRISGLFVHDK